MASIFSRVIGIFGRLIGRSRSKLLPPQPVGAISTEVLFSGDTHFTDPLEHPEYGLTVPRLRSIYQEAEWGWPLRQAMLFEGIKERDGTIGGALRNREAAVIGKPMVILPGDHKDPLSVEAAKRLGESAMGANFRSMVRNVLSSVFFGYAGSEIIWDDVRGWFVPGWYVNVPHARFLFTEDDEMVMVNDTTGRELVNLELGKWVLARPDGRKSVRSGTGRGVSWWAMIKTWQWRDWVAFAEKYGIPHVLGFFDEEASPESRKQLERAITNLGNAGQAVLSKSTDVQIKETMVRGGQAAGTRDLHPTIVAMADEQILRAILGNVLTMSSGGQGATHALGKVGENREFVLTQSDAQFASDILFDSISRPFMAFNGLEGVAPPVWRFHVMRDLDMTTRAKIAESLHRVGMPLSIRQLSDEFGFVVPEEDDDTLAGAMVVSAGERDTEGGS